MKGAQSRCDAGIVLSDVVGRTRENRYLKIAGFFTDHASIAISFQVSVALMAVLR